MHLKRRKLSQGESKHDMTRQIYLDNAATTPVCAAARRALERLENAGVVRGYQVSRGRRAWRAQDVLDLMDEVAEGLGRRQAPADV